MFGQRRLTKTIDRAIVRMEVRDTPNACSACNDSEAENEHDGYLAVLWYVKPSHEDTWDNGAGPVCCHGDDGYGVAELCDDAVVTTCPCSRIPHRSDGVAKKEDGYARYNAADDCGDDNKPDWVAVSSLERETQEESPN